MKKTLLCLFFLFTTHFYAQVSDIEHCAEHTYFDLTSQKTLLIGNLNPAETTVSYHLILEDAQNNISAIATPSNFKNTERSKTIYARIDNNGTVTTNYFNLILNTSLASSVAITPTSCRNENKGTITITATGGKEPYLHSIGNLAYNSNNIFTDLVPGTYSINTKDALGCTTSLSVTINSYSYINIVALTVSPRCNGESNGQIHMPITTGGNPPYTYKLINYNNGEVNNSFYNNNIFYQVPPGRYIIEATDATDCKNDTFVEMNDPTPIVGIVLIENQSITINASGGSNYYTYAISPKLYSFSTQNTFTNLEPGNYTYLIKDSQECYFESSFAIITPTPVVNGKNVINFDFTSGQTLGSIVVDGQNIKWYSSPNSLTGKTSKISETNLPLTTLLVDGVTYYASQSINGIESKERLAVTAKLSGSLSTDDFVLPNFKFYPNPVKNTLSVNNTAVIDEIEIFSLSGKSVLAKKIKNTHSEIDLSATSPGVYFLKVKSEGKIKTLKVIKK